MKIIPNTLTGFIIIVEDPCGCTRAHLWERWFDVHDAKEMLGYGKAGCSIERQSAAWVKKNNPRFTKCSLHENPVDVALAEKPARSTPRNLSQLNWQIADAPQTWYGFLKGSHPQLSAYFSISKVVDESGGWYLTDLQTFKGHQTRTLNKAKQLAERMLIAKEVARERKNRLARQRRKNRGEDLKLCGEQSFALPESACVERMSLK